MKKDTNFCCLTKNIENIVLRVVKFCITKLISLFCVILVVNIYICMMCI